ncbi:Calx-beta domain-containing protein, partial [Gloeocapsa sp. PCC 73106]|uniref:Calx-beta domain-containing protein n=1 Tax=Gloeocapsa sp. PCC 73106 TaxID=102232 RepID=UPI0026F3F128
MKSLFPIDPLKLDTGLDLTTTPFAVTTPSVAISVAPGSVNEDDNSNLVYTISRTGNISTSLNVRFSVRGTAQFNSDYTQIGGASFSRFQGSLNLPSGVASTTITLDPIADNVPEDDETAILTLTRGTGYVISNFNSATGTITSDEGSTPPSGSVPSVSIAVSPSSVEEDGVPNLIYFFTRTGNTSNALNGVAFTLGGTARINDSDYTVSGANQFNNTSGTVNFAAGSNTATVTINPTADNKTEPDETVELTINNGTGYTVGSPNRVTGRILDDDFVPTISVAVAPSSVEENGIANLVYTFTRSGSTGSALNGVRFNVAGSADLNTDYLQSGASTFNSTSGTVNFAPGSDTATVTINPDSDDDIEFDETVQLTV